jgi:ankyrin repeat protein
MDMVMLLLHSGMDIKQAALDSALSSAAHGGHLDVVELLLQYEADVDAGCGSSSTSGLLNAALRSTTNRRVMASRLKAAVCGAASGTQLELLQFLLTPVTRFLPGPADATGCHILQQILDKGLEEAILQAAAQSKEVVAFLLQQGADPDYNDGKLLRLAVQHKQGAVLEQLLGAGASKIETALVAASVRGDEASTTKLLSATKAPVDQAGAALLSAAQGGGTS